MLKTNSIISLLVWNYPEYIKNILNSLSEYKISKKPYEIFILDQGSDEETKLILKNTKVSTHLITLEKNIGFSKGHNLILKRAREKYSFNYLCLVNSDIIFKEHYWLDKLNMGLSKSSEFAISGPSGVRINLSRQNYCDGIIASNVEMKAGDYDLISGSLFSVKMSVVNELQLFDEIFTPAYFEDADLNFRYKKNGFKLNYVPLKYMHDYLSLKTPEERLRNTTLVNEFGDYYKNNKAIFIKRWEPENFLRKESAYHSDKISKLKSMFFPFRQEKLKRKFTKIFKNNLFSGKESVSGPGSDLIQTKIIRTRLPQILKSLNVKVFLDAPCGDFFWMKHVDLKEVDYIGIDVVCELIKKNTKNYGNNKRKYICKDIVSEKLPDADLILIRDCWVHLTNEDIFKCIMNLKHSNIKYLLTTSFPGLNNNRELDNIWRPLNLELPPFNFRNLLEIVNENCTENGGIYSDKSLLLIEVSMLPDFDLK